MKKKLKGRNVFSIYFSEALYFLGKTEFDVHSSSYNQNLSILHTTLLLTVCGGKLKFFWGPLSGETGRSDRRAVHNTNACICKMLMVRQPVACSCPCCETSPKRARSSSRHYFSFTSRSGKDIWVLGALHMILSVKGADSCIILCPLGNKSARRPWSLQGPARGGVIYNNKADVGGHRSKGIKMKAVPWGALMAL